VNNSSWHTAGDQRLLVPTIPYRHPLMVQLLFKRERWRKSVSTRGRPRLSMRVSRLRVMDVPPARRSFDRNSSIMLLLEQPIRPLCRRGSRHMGQGPGQRCLLNGKRRPLRGHMEAWYDTIPDDSRAAGR
jgi:hypothetical protein